MSNGGGGNGGDGETDANKYLGWRIFSGAVVVIGGLAAVVVALGLVLNTYEVKDEAQGAGATTAAQTAAATTVTAADEAGGAGGGGAASDGAGADGTASGGAGGGGAQSEPEPAPEPEAASAVPTTDSTSVSASSVVAILTPVIAGILGVAGLFFGISGTGSARGREADAKVIEAATSSDS